MTTEIDISRFQRGIAGLIDHLEIEPAKVIKKECGELMKTLVKVTPPKDPAKTRRTIDSVISSKFDIARESGGHPYSGTGNIEWYAWNSRFLFGVAPENDKTGASVSDLYELNKHLTKGGRQSLAFVHPRQRQTVILSGKILTKPSTINRLKAKIKSNVGRLKAGWLVAWAAGRIQLSGSNMPPQFVTKHAQGAKGRFVDGLGVKGFPTFSIANSAPGITKAKANGFIQFALDLRAKAMATNLRLLVSGKKHLGDYAK